MDLQSLSERAQRLDDIELAILLSLISQEHCLLQSDSEHVEALSDQVTRIATEVFALSVTQVSCNGNTTIEDFIAQMTSSISSDQPPSKRSQAALFPSKSSPSDDINSTDESHLPNIVVASHLNQSPVEIQNQVLEFLRTRRIFSHTAVYAAPKPFLLVVCTATGSAPLSYHLNDYIFMSHTHRAADGFSVPRRASSRAPADESGKSHLQDDSINEDPMADGGPLFSRSDLEEIAQASSEAVMTAVVYRYMHDVAIFLRMHRALAGGVTPRATRYLEGLSRALAALHGLGFVTPSLVTLAAAKIYPHRLVLVAPHDERTLQYGSDLAAVRQLLAGLTPTKIIDQALAEIEVPV